MNTTDQDILYTGLDGELAEEEWTTFEQLLESAEAASEIDLFLTVREVASREQFRVPSAVDDELFRRVRREANVRPASAARPPVSRTRVRRAAVALPLALATLLVLLLLPIQQPAVVAAPTELPRVSHKIDTWIVEGGRDERGVIYTIWPELVVETAAQ